MYKALVFAHGHPEYSPGGGEIAAHQMFHEIKSRPDWSAVFVGRIDPALALRPVSLVSGDDEIGLATRSEFFRFHNEDEVFLFETLPELLRRVKPDVIHLHHFLHLGIEMIRVINELCPDTPLVLTLHEYYAICNNNGQMITTVGDRLCRKSSPTACSKCFPSVSQEDFFLRERLIKAHFGGVDHFISPSHFLKQRYVDWGLRAEHISVIENGQSPAPRLPPRELMGAKDRRGRFSFFGQLQRFKGLEVLVDAMKLIPAELCWPKGPIRLAIHGSGLQWQPKAFQDRIHASLASLGERAKLYGRYQTDELPLLMADADWVVMPSIWWENSPIVIQEAQNFGRPLVVSGIGGMAEKVEHLVNGIHVRPNDPQSLADGLIKAAFSEGLWEKCAAGAKAPPTLRETVDATFAIYHSLMEAYGRARAPLTRAAAQ